MWPRGPTAVSRQPRGPDSGLGAVPLHELNDISLYPSRNVGSHGDDIPARAVKMGYDFVERRKRIWLGSISTDYPGCDLRPGLPFILGDLSTM